MEIPSNNNLIKNIKLIYIYMSFFFKKKKEEEGKIEEVAAGGSHPLRGGGSPVSHPKLGGSSVPPSGCICGGHAATPRFRMVASDPRGGRHHLCQPPPLFPFLFLFFVIV
jgi:hypothetical protein